MPSALTATLTPASEKFLATQDLEPVPADRAKPKGDWSQRFGIYAETGASQRRHRGGFDPPMTRDLFFNTDRKTTLQTGMKVSYSRPAMAGGRAEELSMNAPFAGATVIPETGKQTRSFGIAPSPTLCFGDIVSFQSTVNSRIPELSKSFKD